MDDPVWTAAWDWVLRQKDSGSWVATDSAQFAEWLSQSAEHRQAYAKASRLWELTGLIPRVGVPPSDTAANGEAH